MTKYIYHDLRETIGSDGEYSKLELIINPDTEEVTVKLQKSYSKRYSLKELEQAERDYEALNGSGYVIDIERLKKMRYTDPKKEDSK